MANNKTTKPKTASLASKILNDGRFRKTNKQIAGSVLSQTGSTKKQTSIKIASKASDTLTNTNSGKNTKTVAGSALSQTKKSKK